jgi:pimeloyl-ACP methyl ester carboxylesterase
MAHRVSVRVGNRGTAVLAALGGATALLFLAFVPVSAPASATVPTHGSITWTPCPKVAGYECGTLSVPLDYAHPSKGTVPLAVMERPVPNSEGVIVFNPGGPGESGDLILPILANLMPETLQQHFSFVSFDERGTGASEPLLCGPTATAASSAVAGTAAASRTFAGLRPSCAAKYPALFPSVNTTTSARDMDEVRAALGVPRIDYYGLSYGTALGSVYAQLFPHRVGAMVLDGAVDLNLSLVTDAAADADAIERALPHELQTCTAQPGCPLGTDPVGVYEKVQERRRHHAGHRG